jgi:hypothetical protein
MLFVTFKEKSHGRILLARLADRFRSLWKQTSEETMELVFRLSDSQIFPLDLLCPIVMYLNRIPDKIFWRYAIYFLHFLLVKTRVNFTRYIFY